MIEKALPVCIFENKELGNSSNHGISERYDRILLLCEEGFVDVDMDNPPENLCKVVANYGGYFHVEPVKHPEPGCFGWMAGGSIVASTDSRFNRISSFPLSLHDRQESEKLYDCLSR